ncbi:U5 small nuclear ribonucleoprotein 40 kDa protein-like isoform X2 [Macrosteles quadrilineatus]|uniref:U5 small nuclear ribonucleoprotein 40 kDa protein-like isoform X2 n=1 Tax=Macrosteles quadrilineatus TaxID=74068 RepID=UPI0023E14607|nr:U5 small nuclear ribonucleoprotein 40 kDa protein-like isoform X2 [Macrosteles quadrilineatus]
MLNKMSKGKLLDLPLSLRIDCEKDVLCCKYSPNKEFFVAGHMDGIIRVYSAYDGNLINKLVRPDITEDLPVTSVQFRLNAHNSQASALLSTYTDGRVLIWDYENGKVLLDLKENRQVLGSAYHPKLNKFLTVGDNAAIYLYNAETGQREQTYEKGTLSDVVDGHTSRVFTAVFHPQQTSEFVSGGWDSVVHFWDLRTHHSIRFIRGVHMCGEGLDISKSGRELYCGQWVTSDTIIVGGTDPNLLRVVSLKSLSTIMHYKGNSSGVYCLDHYIKTSKAGKKDSVGDIRTVYSIDKLLIQSDFMLK